MELLWYRCDRCGVIRKHVAHISMNLVPFDFDLACKKDDWVKRAFPEGVDLCEPCFDKLQAFFSKEGA